ncbi:Epidermal growth factor receptor substrate 15-like 1 [Hypsizygus marmoreus]|uniref:Epidermal growth factor receptor substrate 15-like 1 n=1 Tax=Hypsizygus marmoreus TaxID=39966 RepID=A0A369KGI3_HYPMA|nr:Epidermal growth factor receptor substrate 15-like 1 [Hypsizygus marmoreus]
MSVGFVPSEEELALVDRIYSRAGCSRPGIISGDTAVELFSTSVDLSPIVLSSIWNIADEDRTGNLTEIGVVIAIRLIGWAQSGKTVDPGLVNTPGPLPNIKGITDTDSTYTPPIPVTPQFPPFTQRDRDAFQNVFVDCGPVDGLLNGEKVRDFFLKSGLSPEDLWQIWNHADTQKRGALDGNDFALGMYLIQAALQGRLTSIPESIPDEIHEQIFGTTTGIDAIPTPVTSPLLSDSSVSSPRILTVQPTVRSEVPSLPSSLPAIPLPLPDNSPYELHEYIQNQDEWDVSPAEKAIADESFDVLDPRKHGFVEGDVAAKFMLRYRLPPEDLAHIWDLADFNNDNRLTRDGFAIAMHLIQRRLSGIELPFTLPLTLIPPSLRPGSHDQTPVPPRHSVSSLAPVTLVRPPRDARVLQGPPLPPKPMSPHVVPRASFSKPVPNGLRSSPETDPFDDQHPSAVVLDQYAQLEGENRVLTAKIEALLAQSERQREAQTEAEVLRRENESLSGKILEMEQLTSLLLQANERHPLVEDLTRQNKELTHRISDLEQSRSTQLAESSRRMEASTQENKDLRVRLREAREAAEAASIRASEEADGLKRKIELLGEDNEHLRSRAQEMERSLSQSHSSSSTTNVRELEILMGDVTRENEELKRRLRQIQRSTTHLLLSPNSDYTVNDDLRRENQRLSANVQELEQLTKQLQMSSEDNELQRVLRDVTHENDALKARLREMRQQITQLQQSSDRVEPLQREISDLKAEIQRLHIEIQNAPSPHSHEDLSIPPPAYDD